MPVNRKVRWLSVIGSHDTPLQQYTMRGLAELSCVFSHALLRTRGQTKRTRYRSRGTAVAQAILTQNAEALSAELDVLRDQTQGMSAAAIADALFARLGTFMAGHPAYSALLDLPGDDGWRRAMRGHRRAQIAALFAAADPPLPAGQAERLAVIVPQLMRIPLTLISEKRLRDGVLEELRLMLSRHLEAGG